MSIVQYDFFQTKEEAEISAILDDIEETKNMANKVRKALFARHGELYRLYSELSERLEIIERHICKKPVLLSVTTEHVHIP
jgi:DNA-binding phage protein